MILEIWEKLLRDSAGMEAVVFLMMAIDLVSMVLETRRTVRGHGASGIWLVTWCVACLLVLFSDQAIPITGSPRWLYKIYNSLMLTAFHLLCLLAIPRLFRRMLIPGTEDQ